MANVNALAPMRTCSDSTAVGDDDCGVEGSTADGDVPEGTHTFEVHKLPVSWCVVSTS